MAEGTRPNPGLTCGSLSTTRAVSAQTGAHSRPIAGRGCEDGGRRGWLGWGPSRARWPDWWELDLAVIWQDNRTGYIGRGI